MVRRCLKWLERPRRFWGGFILLLALAGSFYIPAVPFSMAQFAAHSHGGQILDMTFNYTPAEAYRILTGYGAVGRAHYWWIFLADLVYPLLYALIFTALLQRLRPDAKRSRFLNFLPLLAGVADYLENMGIAAQLISFPARLTEIARLTNLCTILKFTFLGLVLALILITLIWNLSGRLVGRAKRPRMILFLLFLSGSCFLLLYSINHTILISTIRQIYNSNNLPAAQTALILGARVYDDGSLSPMLEDRVLTGIKLYQTGKVKKLLLSGDHGRTANDELNPMRNLALQHGIPPEDIFIDHAGFDTYSSLYRARDVFRVQSLIIVSQRFHLPRALFIADRLGVPAIALAADRREYSSSALAYSELREIPARLKAFLMAGAIKPPPRFLGPAIPITRDGRVTMDRYSK